MRRWLVALVAVIGLAALTAYAAVGGWSAARRLPPLVHATPTSAGPHMLIVGSYVTHPTIVLPTAAPVQTSTPIGG